MRSLPEALLDLAEAAHAARRAGHSETEIVRAAGLPPVVPVAHGMSVDEVVALTVRENVLSHPDDIAYAREDIERIARLLGVTSVKRDSSSV